MNSVWKAPATASLTAMRALKSGFAISITCRESEEAALRGRGGVGWRRGGVKRNSVSWHIRSDGQTNLVNGSAAARASVVAGAEEVGNRDRLSTGL